VSEHQRRKKHGRTPIMNMDNNRYLYYI